MTVAQLRSLGELDVLEPEQSREHRLNRRLGGGARPVPLQAPEGLEEHGLSAALGAWTWTSKESPFCLAWDCHLSLHGGTSFGRFAGCLFGLKW